MLSFTNIRPNQTAAPAAPAVELCMHKLDRGPRPAYDSALAARCLR